ncbi:MAG: ABC transporter substrate-binding protein [Candidatus Methanomethylicia archaeon]
MISALNPVSRKGLILIVVAIIIIAAGYLGYIYTVPKPTVAKPVKIAILTDFTLPVLKGQGEASILAIEDINKTGGILGRRVEYVWLNTMRKVDVAITAYRKALIEEGAKYVVLEGVSEEMLALMEEGTKLYSQYPHILMYVGMASEVSLKIINEYDKYKFAFRMFDVDYDANVRRPYDYFLHARDVLKVSKIAILIEDAAWTYGAREGFQATTKLGDVKQKPLRELAKELGLEVVYEAKIAVGEKNFVPILETIAARGAQYIFAMTSWYTDCVTLTKQWATSAAGDAYLALYGGPNHWTTFWDLTGGAALGVISGVYDIEDFPPVSPYTQSFIKKMHEKGLRVDMSAHYYYSLIYHIKAAIEKAGDPDNIDAVIKALEEVEFKGHTILLAPKVFLGEKSPIFHSYPAYVGFLFQFQGKDKVVNISDPNDPILLERYPKDLLGKYCHPELAKPPAELRKQAG